MNEKAVVLGYKAWNKVIEAMVYFEIMSEDEGARMVRDFIVKQLLSPDTGESGKTYKEIGNISLYRVVD